MKKRILAFLAASVFLMTGCGKIEETTTTTTIDDDKVKVTEEVSDTASEVTTVPETEAPAETAATETEPAVTTENTDKESETEEPDAAVTEEKSDDQNDPDAEVSENTIIIELYPDIAPITCENFLSLVNDKFYDGLTFHRVIDDFMAQGGDPKGNGTGGSDKNIKGEFASNGVKNNLSHTRGVISMARGQMNDSASSQFFICYTDVSFLDGNYAAFGKVESGMEVVDNFLKVKRTGGEGGTPTSPIKMKEVTEIEPDEDGHPRVQIVMEDFLN